jgi:hypothetical protein
MVLAAYRAFIPLVEGFTLLYFGKCICFFKAIFIWTLVNLTYCRLDVIGGLLSLYNVLQWIGVIYMLVLITENGYRIEAAARPLRDPLKNLIALLFNKFSL